MSFTAFGRGCEQNRSSSQPGISSDANHNGSIATASKGDLQTNGNGHPPAASNGNGRHAPAFRTTLSSGVSIKGTLKFRTEFETDGDVEGSIESLGLLTVGRNGRVRGDIQTRSVTVHGTVDGNLSVGEKCELRSGCTLRGDIETSRLVVDENVNFTGSAAIAMRDYLSEMRPVNGNGHN